MSLPLILSLAALWVLVVFHSLLLLGLVRAVHRLQESARGQPAGTATGNGELEAGQPAPHFSATDVFGAMIDEGNFRARLNALLFVTPTCESCTVSLPEMLDQLVAKTDGNVLVICRGDQEECRDLVRSHKLTVPVAVDEDLGVSEAFRVSVVPSAVLINDRKEIVSYGTPMRGDELNELIAKQEASTRGASP